MVLKQTNDPLGEMTVDETTALHAEKKSPPSRGRCLWCPSWCPICSGGGRRNLRQSQPLLMAVRRDEGAFETKIGLENQGECTTPPAVTIGRTGKEGVDHDL